MRFLLTLALAFLPSVLSKTSGGDFAVTINGQVFNPPEGEDFKLDKQTTRLTQVLFRGIHVNFDLNLATMAVVNYTLTGALDDLRLVNVPTMIFASKTPGLTAAQRANPTMTRLEIKDDKVVLRITIGGGDYKIQAIDSAQGGILQTETEFDGPIEWTHVLGPTVFFFVNEFTGKINIGNGLEAITKAQSPTNFHEMLLGKDSPEAATQTFQDGATSKWLIQPGGRLGAVFGHDAVEQSPAGASNCTSQCQNRNRIRGSLPIPPDPTNPVPLPTSSA